MYREQPLGGGELAPVGASPANYWGVYDLHGLIWEWVEDFNSALVVTDSRDNNGPGAATGAVFTYDVPAGATIQSINAPTGWSCSQQSQQVQCWYSQGIDPSASTPAVQITIVPPAGARSIPTHVTTTPKGATDPSTDNNTSNTDTLLTLTKLSGGGFSFGCSAVPGAAEPSALSGALLMLLGLVGRRRLRRAR